MKGKELVVKLDRLSKSDIEKIINSYKEANLIKTISYYFSINFDENGQWKCIEKDGKLVPTTLDNNSIQINLLENDHDTLETSSVIDEITVEVKKELQPREAASSTTIDLTSSESLLAINDFGGKLLPTTIDNNNSIQINILENDHDTPETSSVSDNVPVEVNKEWQPHKDASSTTIDLKSSETVLTISRCSDATKKT